MVLTELVVRWLMICHLVMEGHSPERALGPLSRGVRVPPGLSLAGIVHRSFADKRRSRGEKPVILFASANSPITVLSCSEGFYEIRGLLPAGDSIFLRRVLDRVSPFASECCVKLEP